MSEILSPAKRLLYWSNLPGDWQDNDLAQDAIVAALARYNADRPRIDVASIDGDGSTTSWDLSGETNFTSWNESFSDVLRVAYPWTVADESWLDNEAWSVVVHPTTGKTLLLTGTPDSGALIVVEFTTLWTEVEVPANHRSAVAKLAAAHIARAFASRRAATGSGSLNAAVTLGVSESDRWGRMATSLEKAYTLEIAGDETAVEAGMAVVQLEPWYGPDLEYQ